MIPARSMPFHEPSRRRRASATKGALLLAAALGLAAGCRDRCTAEGQQTQAKLEAARTAGADAYASEASRRAADLFANGSLAATVVGPLQQDVTRAKLDLG